MLDAVVSGVDDEFAERSEATVAADREKWSVEERMVLAQVILTLRPNNTNDILVDQQINQTIDRQNLYSVISISRRQCEKN